MKKLLSSSGSGGGGAEAGGVGADGSGGSAAGTVVKEGRSVFHTKLVTHACAPDMHAAVESVRDYVTALERFCGAGSHVSGQFAALLSATVYSDVAEQFETMAKEVEAAVKTEGSQVRTDVETNWSQLGRSYEGETTTENDCTVPEDIKLVAKSLLRVMQMHSQFFLTTTEVFAQFSKMSSLEDLTNGAALLGDVSTTPTLQEQTQAEQQTKKNIEPQEAATNNKNLELRSPPNNSDSPSRLRKHISSFFSKKLGGGGSSSSGKSGSGSGDVAQSSFYVQTPPSDETTAAQLPSGVSGPTSSLDSGAGIPGKSSGATAPPEAGQEEDVIAAGAGPPGDDTTGALVAGDGGGAEHPGANNSSAVENFCNHSSNAGHLAVSVRQKEVRNGAHLASQEELDNVIDLLSGFPKHVAAPTPVSSSLLHGGHPHPHTVDGLPPKHPSAPTAALSAQSKAVGSHLTHAPGPPHPPPPPVAAAGFPSHMFSHPPPQLPADPTYDPSLMGHRTHQHRRSDGLIGETLNRGNQKTNTWPYRPPQQPRVSDMTAPSSVNATLGPPYAQGPQGAFDGHVSDAEYTRYLAAVKQMKQNSHGGAAVGGSTNPLLPGHSNPWSTGGENNFNRSWPLHMFPQDGHEGAMRPWTGAVGDSSSCSDESSNGETPWMMGIDLVSTMDKRRHSSGDESYPSGPISTSDSRPHSVEDLLETKTTNTWPMKQQQQQQAAAWGKSMMGGAGGMTEPSAMPSHMHPPLQMQWSDPLTNRPLTTWGSGGLTGALSHQSLQMYAGLGGGGSALPDQIPPPHPNMDNNTYPVIS